MTPTAPETLLDAEAELFKKLYPPLRRFAAVVTPVEVEPDDLLQEAVTRALRRGSLTELDNPGAYLRRAMVNLASRAISGDSSPACIVPMPALPPPRPAVTSTRRT